MGWVMGLEPTTLGTTNRCSNQLSYTHHANASKIYKLTLLESRVYFNKIFPHVAGVVSLAAEGDATLP